MEHLFKPKCIVYIVWQGATCLYIGMSTKGIVRPLTNDKLRDHRKKITNVEIRDCSSAKEARVLEKKLTLELSPKLCTRGPGRPKKEKTTVVYARIPESIKRSLDEKCKREHRQMSAVIGLILQAHFQGNPSEIAA